MRLATPATAHFTNIAVIAELPCPSIRRSQWSGVRARNVCNGCPNSKPFSYRVRLMLPCADACPELLETPLLPRTHA